MAAAGASGRPPPIRGGPGRSLRRPAAVSAVGAALRRPTGRGDTLPAGGGAAVLGAPLIHDFCLISLSDLLTPWEKIEARLLAAAQADFVVCLYNPSSKKRHDYLQKACDLMMKYKSPDTICGTVSNIAREGEEAHVMTLKELRDTQVDMFTTVFIGNSQTKEINNKMVTPRGYRNV